MNFDQLKYFLTIVKTGSFSEAADEMFISQSSMSKQIKALEHELGIDLFKREHSKIYLTSAGRNSWITLKMPLRIIMTYVYI